MTASPLTKATAHQPFRGDRPCECHLLAAMVAISFTEGARAVTKVFEGMLLADYHQFYLADTGAKTDYAADVTDETISQRVICRDDTLVVFAARNMEVSVTVEVHDSTPALDLDDVDHVVEGGLRSTGTIAIAGCTDYLPDAARFPVPVGDLKARVVFTGLGTLSEDGLEGEDRYFVHLWPGKIESIRVLKQWNDD